jgi:DNA polymerase II large subunit
LSFSATEAWNRVRPLAPFPERLTSYYNDILSQYAAAYNSAAAARSQGYDPIELVESKTVFDLADRVNQMLGLNQFEGLVERLRVLLKTTTKERAALTISQEIALGKFGNMAKQRALDYGVRAGLAVMTDGVTVAPVEGIYSINIEQNDDNSDYASVSYAGPMRSAGGTEAGFSLVIADVTAKKLGLSNYHARQDEIDRFVEELRIYEREVGNFQYKVTDDDIRLAISNLPIEVDGVETDPYEVVVHRGLKRVTTDRMRGGALRVLNDGVIGRAHKLAKKLASLNISGWEWLTEIKGGTQQSTNETEQAGAHFEEVISGRAVLSMPKRKGGFRLRYGRSINTGLSAVGVHPAMAALLNYPVVPGTQVKVDLPGKAATIAFVDSIEGPTVLLNDGTVKHVGTVAEAEALRQSLVRIIDLGDILISYGDFLENNKNLPPSPYVLEWWSQDLVEALNAVPEATERLEEGGIGSERLKTMLSSLPAFPPTLEEAFTISKALGIPLCPAYTPRFDRLTVSDLIELRKSCRLEGRDVTVDITSHHTQWALQNTLVAHSVNGDSALVTGDEALLLRTLLGLGHDITPGQEFADPAEAVKALSGVRIGRQTTTTVGIRVGRPEKAMLRRLKPPVHTLFPVGEAGGTYRDIVAASKKGKIETDVVNSYCPACNERRLGTKCPKCGGPTQRFLTCPRCGISTQDPECPKCGIKTVTHSTMDYDLKAKLDSLKETLPFNPNHPIKGVRGLTSVSKTPEPVEKGIIRSKHSVFVYKDGTLRIDATNAPLTHFRPTDVHLGLDTLAGLGYTTDHMGRALVDQDQLLELKPQDIILPEDIADDLVRMAQFVDDELQGFYGLPAFYGVTGPKDMLGKIVIGLAPHTSVGIVGRIAGFSAAEVCFANPCWHAAKRRDCDGDGDSILMVMDALVNFSTEFIPNQIGGLMDTPLLVQPILVPAEVDEQAHNFDIASVYPREFYEKTQSSPPASALEALVERIGSRLATERQFYDYGFTHGTTAVAAKRARAAYSTLKALTDKIAMQVDVANKIEAVSTKEVVESIIRTHLIRDIMGNTKKYATQSFKCKKCGITLRRPPVSWACPRCGGEIRETLTQASVQKYLKIAQRLAEEHNVDPYLRSRLDMVQRELDQLFEPKKGPEQTELTDFSESVQTTLVEEVSG